MAWTTEQYLAAIKAAEDAENQELADEITGMMAADMAPSSRGMGETVAHGATLGLSSALIPSARKAVREYREREPWTAAGLTMLGGLGAGAGIGAGVGGLARAPGVTGRIGRWLSQPRITPQATLGAAEGAVLGAVESEPGERLVGAGTGAGMGALFGGASAPVSRLITNRLAPGQEAERMLRTEMAADLGGAPGTRDFRQLEARSVAEPQRTLAELSGPSAEMQAAVAHSIGGRARNIAEEALESRRASASARMLETLGQDIGTDEAVANAANRLQEQAKVDAGPLYREAYAAPFDPDDELIALTQGSERRKLLRQGYNRARQGEGIRSGRELPEWNKLIGEEGPGLESLTLEQWDHIKRGLDDRYRKVVRTDPSLARDIWDFRRQLVTKLDELGPDEYRQARAAWAGPRAQEEALEEGAKVFRNEPEATANLMQSYSDAEKGAFRISMAQQIRKKIQSVPVEGGMPRFTSYQQEQMRAAFPSDDEFQNFWNAITSERDMQRFRNMVLAGPITARLQAGQERQQRLLGAARGIAEAVQGAPMEGARTVLGNLIPRQSATLPERINDPLAEMLFSQGAAIPPVLQRLQRPAVAPAALAPMATTESAIIAEEARRRLRGVR